MKPVRGALGGLRTKQLRSRTDRSSSAKNLKRLETGNMSCLVCLCVTFTAVSSPFIIIVGLQICYWFEGEIRYCDSCENNTFIHCILTFIFKLWYIGVGDSGSWWRHDEDSGSWWKHDEALTAILVGPNIPEAIDGNVVVRYLVQACFDKAH